MLEFLTHTCVSFVDVCYENVIAELLYHAIHLNMDVEFSLEKVENCTSGVGGGRDLRE